MKVKKMGRPMPEVFSRNSALTGLMILSAVASLLPATSHGSPPGSSDCLTLADNVRNTSNSEKRDIMVTPLAAASVCNGYSSYPPKGTIEVKFGSWSVLMAADEDSAKLSGLATQNSNVLRNASGPLQRQYVLGPASYWGADVTEYLKLVAWRCGVKFHAPVNSGAYIRAIQPNQRDACDDLGLILAVSGVKLTVDRDYPDIVVVH